MAVVRGKDRGDGERRGLGRERRGRPRVRGGWGDARRPAVVGGGHRGGGAVEGCSSVWESSERERVCRVRREG